MQESVATKFAFNQSERVLHFRHDEGGGTEEGKKHYKT